MASSSASSSSMVPANDRKRVKVYELRDNDWFDRGTGFCVGHYFEEEPRIYVESEDVAGRILLKTNVTKEDGYQKQQDTLIVWTTKNGVDMALSFQEADGCALVWEFISQVQTQLAAQDEILSDDAMEGIAAIMLPEPSLATLPEIEQSIRIASNSQAGRDALCKFILQQEYLPKMLPLVEQAEDFEDLDDLHRLCGIMKLLILLNDNHIIEMVVSDACILGVVGALEYDPDFPTHKANHRQYLSDESRYKEVVPIRDARIREKIRHTWRLQYLKDVVLARILDDPTFSVLNSLIFFNQVDIVQHLQTNGAFLKELFGLFQPDNPEMPDIKRKEDGVHFLHQCAAIAKNLQAPARSNLFQNFIGYGLFEVISFAVKHPLPAMRTTGIDIMVALLDHDAIMMRSYMLKAFSEKRTPLTDTLIDLLHAETDLGVKTQLADALKILLDPPAPMLDSQPGRGSAVDFMAKARAQGAVGPQEALGQMHFDESAKRLFAPLRALEGKDLTIPLTYQEVALYWHLVDILIFFIRQQLFRSERLLRRESLMPRVCQLLTVPHKHLKLTALKFFRSCLNLSVSASFFQSEIINHGVFAAILDIVYETMPRDNLLNSACLELFDFIKRENIKGVMIHVVETHREKLEKITYVDTFATLVQRYDQMEEYSSTQENAQPPAGSTLYSQTDEEIAQHQRAAAVGGRWQGVKEMDAAEEEYFNASDDEDDIDVDLSPYVADTSDLGPESITPEDIEKEKETLLAQRADATTSISPININGSASPIVKQLVDYPDDEDEDDEDQDQDQDQDQNDEHVSEETDSAHPTPSTSGEATPTYEAMDTSGNTPQPDTPTSSRPSTPAALATPPPERLSEKRRREEDEDDDELGKLSSGIKRRNSSTGPKGTSNVPSASPTPTMGMVTRKRGASLGNANASPSSAGAGSGPAAGGKKIAIHIASGPKGRSTSAGSGIQLQQQQPKGKMGLRSSVSGGFKKSGEEIGVGESFLVVGGKEEKMEGESEVKKGDGEEEKENKEESSKTEDEKMEPQSVEGKAVNANADTAATATATAGGDGAADAETSND